MLYTKYKTYTETNGQTSYVFAMEVTVTLQTANDIPHDFENSIFCVFITSL